jgi:hypothetical protein
MELSKGVLMGKFEQCGIVFDEKWKRDRSEDDAGDGESTDEAVEVPEPLGKQELRALLLTRKKKE